MMRIRQERWAEAEQSLEEGLALARRMPYPYAEARLLHVYGQMHLEKGEPGPAPERLEAALAIFQQQAHASSSGWAPAVGAPSGVELVDIDSLQSVAPQGGGTRDGVTAAQAIGYACAVLAFLFDDTGTDDATVTGPATYVR